MRWGHLSGVEIAGILAVIAVIHLLIGIEFSAWSALGFAMGVWLYRLIAPAVAGRREPQ